ncbi:toll/interleukin-1 receptor domain-containing protein [Streptomyces vinaceus]|uniref:toll/interleukin-1 receptor domain-containing protein n=1 Tax=Streptomyces vinaceus TaxID=1960 RepID=UPI00380B78A2
MPDEELPAAGPGGSAPAAPVVEDYDAFISYTHEPDHALAKAIQRGLFSVGRKAWRAPTVKVFRDEETLDATGDLPKALQHHLDRSRHLILVASPESARAEYVLAELAYWLEHKSSTNILIAVAGGVISWPSAGEDFDWTVTTALPEVLRGEIPTQPLWSDFRKLRDEKGKPLTLRDEAFLGEIAKLGARLHGVSKEKLVSIERRNQRNALRRAYTWSALLLVLFLTAGVLAFVANDQRGKAEQRAREATSRRLAALSRTVHGTDGSLQYLLAAQAQRMAPTTEARGALFEAAAGSDGRRTLQGTQALARLVGHEQGVKGVGFSPGGARAGTVDGAGAVRVWATGAAGDPVTVPGLTQPRLTFTADGEFVVSDGSRLQWRDAVTGAVREDRDLGFVPAHLEWLGSGRTVLAAGPDATVVAARPDGGIDRAPDGGSSAVTFLGSPAHAEVAVVAAADGTVTVRRKADLAVEARWHLGSGEGRPVAVSADGSRLAVLKETPGTKPASDGSGFPVVSVWEARGGKQIGQVRTSEYYVPRDAAFIGGGTSVVVATSSGADGAPGQLLTADPAKNEPAASPGLAVPTTAFAVRTSDDGRRLLVGGGDPTAYIDAIGPRDADFGASVLPDGVTPVRPLSVAGGVGRVVVRRAGEVGFADIGTGKAGGVGGAVKTTMVTAGDAAAISTNGNWLVSAAGDVFDLRDPSAPKRTGRIPKPLGALGFDGGGNRVAYVAGEDDLVVADLPSMDVRHGSAGRRLCSANQCSANSALSPDGSLLAVRPGSENSFTGQLPAGADPADSPADHGRTPLVLVSLREGWNVRAVLDLPEPGPVAFKGDGTLLVQAGGTLLTVDAAAPAKAPVTRSADQRGTWAFGAGRADKDLAIAGQCGISLTDPLTWGEIAKVPFDGVNTDAGCDGTSAAWAGETLLTSDGDECRRTAVSGGCPLRRWNTRAETLVPRVCGLAARNLTPGEWSQYLPEWPYERTCTEYAKPAGSKPGTPSAAAGTGTPAAPAPGSSTAPSPAPAVSAATPPRSAAPTPTPSAPAAASAGPYPPGSVPQGSGGCSPGRNGLRLCTVGKRDGAPYQDSPTGKPLPGLVTGGEHPFLCQRQGPAHTYGVYHNDWWARVVLREANGEGGWVSAVYLSGGDNDQPVPGLPVCPAG